MTRVSAAETVNVTQAAGQLVVTDQSPIYHTPPHAAHSETPSDTSHMFSKVSRLGKPEETEAQASRETARLARIAIARTLA